MAVKQDFKRTRTYNFSLFLTQWIQKTCNTVNKLLHFYDALLYFFVRLNLNSSLVPIHFYCTKNTLHNTSFCVLQNKQSHTGLELLFLGGLFL